VDCFGLNYDIIVKHGLTWIDGLITGSGEDLGNPKHPDHFKPYVRDYIKKYDKKKVEANALLVDPAAGRALCRAAILKYVDQSKVNQWKRERDRLRRQVRDLLPEALRSALDEE
jgi:hypothetical protein